MMNKYTTNRHKNQSTTSQKNPKISLFINILIVFFVLFIGLFIFYGWFISKPLSDKSDFLYIKINSGDNREQIANKLVELEVIDSETLFIWYTKISGAGGDIKAGYHSIRQNMSIKEIVATLEELPDDTTVRVTIPEGLRYDEIAEKLAQAFETGIDSTFSREKYIEIAQNPRNYEFSEKIKNFFDSYLPEEANLEGFLYPDTYEFNSDTSEIEVIEKQISTLYEKIGEDNWRKIDESDYSLYQILVIASMLERESFGVEEAKSISDIIQRRWENGETLGIDATSLYALKDWKAEITYQVLQDDNPYNTRKNIGLPPTPICNPYVGTIEAVLVPEENEYNFYMHDNDGNIHYAKTNAEHEANVAKYLSESTD